MANDNPALSLRSKLILGLLTPCFLISGLGYYLLGTTSGMTWMAGVMERHMRGSFKMNGMTGSLLGGFTIQQLSFDADTQRLDVQGLQVDWQPRALLSQELHLLRVKAQQIELHEEKVSASATPLTLPASLQLPLDVTAASIHVGSFRWFALGSAQPDFAVSGVEANLNSDRQRHHLQLLNAHLPFGEMAGEVTLASTIPYALDSHITLDTTTPRAEKLKVQADVQGELQHLEIKLKAEGAGLRANGTVLLSPLDEVLLQRIQMQFKGVDVARLFEGMPQTRLSGDLDARDSKRDGLEGNLRLHNDLAAAIDQSRIPIVDARARMKLSTEHWQITRLEAQTPGEGKLSGTLDWNAKNQSGDAQLALRDVDMQALDSRLPSKRMSGKVALDGAGRSQHAVLALTDGESRLTGELTRQGQRIALHSLRLVRGGTSIEGHGQLVLDRSRTFNFTSQVYKLNLAEFAATPPTDLNAEMTIKGELLPEVTAEMRFALANSHFAQYEIGGAGWVAVINGKHGKGELAFHLGDNRISVKGNYGLGADELHFDLAASNLAQIDANLGGQLNGRAALTGSIGEPQLDFSFSGRELILSADQKIASVDAAGDASAQSVTLNLVLQDFKQGDALRVPEASFELQGAPDDHSVKVRAKVEQGTQVREELHLLAHGGLSGLEQGWRALRWQGSLDEFSGAGAVPLRLLNTASVALASGNADLGVADIALGGGRAHLETTRWTPSYWQSIGSFSGLGFRAVNVQDLSPALDNVDTLRFGGSWDVKADSHWNASLQVQRESGDWVTDAKTGALFGLSDLRMSAHAVNDQLQTELSASGEELGEMKVSASVPLTATGTGWTVAPDAPLTGHLYLDSNDLAWLGPSLDSNFQSGGKLKLDADLVGNMHTPRLRGMVQGESLSFGMLDQGVRLEQGQLKARFEEDVVHLDLFDFVSPYLRQPKDTLLGDFKLSGTAGKLSASGTLDLKGDTGGVQISAQQFPLLQRADRWVVASGTGHARFSGNTLILDGDIRADVGLIDQPVSNRPQLAEDVQIVGQEVDESAKQQNKVSATLDLGDKFFIRASGLEARLAGKLDVRGEPGELLSVTGIINAQDAVFDAYGQRLQVERGMVNFQGRMDDPGLNILAYRKGLSVEAGVEVTGTARKPVIRLVSIPNVPDAEKLSWMVLGRVPDSSGIDSSLLLSAATNIMGGQSASRIGQAVGVDELSLNQKAGGDPLLNQVVTVGKRLNPRAYLSYEQGLSSTTGITKFTYTLTPRVTLVTRTGVEDALDLFYSFRYY
ncbi:MAG: translocation/assembly module TamB domain-containing protein [Gallionella sp.]|nr:translocation/assembly module TamB domain-containing protein [Gallionella sp.]